jgi:hypothetical protein
MTDRDVDVVLPVAGLGMGNSVVIGRLWTIWKPSSTRHHSMS